jgi:hypothetical protein
MQSAILRSFKRHAKDVAPPASAGAPPYIGGTGMRKTFTPWALAIAVSVLALVARPSFGATPPTSSRPQPAVTTTAEPHPEIREAIAALQRARDHLQHAAHDFGGHRVEAIRAIDAALRQLHNCLDFDK